MKDLNEADICMQFITPAVQAAGWELHTQIRRELYYTKGRIIVRRKVLATGLPRTTSAASLGAVPRLDGAVVPDQSATVRPRGLVSYSARYSPRRVASNDGEWSTR